MFTRMFSQTARAVLKLGSSNVEEQLEGLNSLLHRFGFGSAEAETYQDRLAAQPMAVPRIVALLASSDDDVQVAAADVLRNLVCGHATNKTRVAAEPDAVPRLVALLGSSSTDVQAAAANALRTLVSQHATSRTRVAAEPDAVPKLVALLSSSSADVQAAAANALRDLVCEHTANKTRVAAQPDTVPKLVVLLSSSSTHVQVSAAAALRNLVSQHAANKTMVAAEPDAVPKLVALLSSSSDDVKAAAANALHILVSQHETNKTRVAAEPDAVPRLVALLGSSSTDVQAAAANALRTLVSQHATNRTRVAAEPGAVPKLVALLSSSSADVQEAAAYALNNLVFEHAANQTRTAAEPDAVSKLVALLGSSSRIVQVAASNALRTLVSRHTANKTRVAAEPDAVPKLVALMSSRSDNVQAPAAYALQALVHEHAANRTRVAAEPGAVPKLVALLSSSNEDVQVAAGYALNNLVFEHAANRTRVAAEPGAVPKLVALLSSSNEDVQVAAAYALNNLVFEHAANQTRVAAEPDAVPKLVALMSSKNDNVQAPAAYALQALVHEHAANRTRVAAEPGAVPKLVALLSSSSEDVQAAAAYALRNLVFEHAANQTRTAAEPDAVSKLVALLSSSSADVQAAAAYALNNLVFEHAANQTRTAAEPDAVPRLVALLGSSSEDVQQQAARCLCSLTEVHKGNQALVGKQLGAISALSAMLHSTNAQLQHSAARTIFSLSSMEPSNAPRLMECPGTAGGLASLLSIERTDTAGWAAGALVWLGAGCSEGWSFLEGVSTDVFAALGHLESPSTKVKEFRSLAQALAKLAQSSAKLKGAIDHTAVTASLLQQYLPGEGVTTTSEGATSPPQQASAPLQDAYKGSAESDQDTVKPAQVDVLRFPAGSSSPGSNGPQGKVAAVVAMLGVLQQNVKMVPLLSVELAACFGTIKAILQLVDDVRVNKAKARFVGSRVEALAAFVVSMADSGQQLQAALEKSQAQLQALRTQFARLQGALNAAHQLVAKWSRPMMLAMAVRFLKANIDRDELNEVELDINQVVHDLTVVVTSLNLAQTATLREELFQKMAAMQATGVTFDAQQADLNELQGNLAQLLGGQQELSAQLAAASQEQRAEWAEAIGLLSRLAADVADIKEGIAGVDRKVDGVDQRLQDIDVAVHELAAYVKELRSGPSSSSAGGNSPSGSSSSKGRSMLRSRLVLDKLRVELVAGAQPLDSGSFASVYLGNYDGAPVAIKQLDMSAFVGKAEEEMYREAAVLAQLGNHPCIVHFYGLVIEEQQQPSTPAARPGGFGGLRQHDSAGSVGRSSFGTCAGLTGAPKKLSVGLVMERCDGSLQALLDNRPQGSLLPLSDSLHIATCIAGGLKYLHQDAPIKVVHADLKPANVLYKGTDIKLTDFGLSHTIAVSTMRSTAQGLVGKGATAQSGGTVLWSAPELLDAWAAGIDTPHSCEGDIYAFGLILYQLLVGRAPFAEFRRVEPLKSAVRGGVRPGWGNWEQEHLQQLEGSVRAQQALAELKSLVEACWAAAPERRPGAQVVLQQLKSLQRTLQPAV